MGDFHSPRGRRASENGRRGSNNADNRRTGDGRGGGKERRASADDIERLVDRLQEVGTTSGLFGHNGAAGNMISTRLVDIYLAIGHQYPRRPDGILKCT